MELQADSLPTEPPGNLKNIGVGSLSLLQRIFPTQESNWGLLHCRRILYQLSYWGSPNCALKNGYSGKFCSVGSHFSRVQLFVTLWIVARQAPLSMGSSRQEYWSGLPFPTPEDLPDPGIELASPVHLLHWQRDSLPLSCQRS